MAAHIFREQLRNGVYNHLLFHLGIKRKVNSKTNAARLHASNKKISLKQFFYCVLAGKVNCIDKHDLTLSLAIISLHIYMLD